MLSSPPASSTIPSSAPPPRLAGTISSRSRRPASTRSTSRSRRSTPRSSNMSGPRPSIPSTCSARSPRQDQVAHVVHSKAAGQRASRSRSTRPAITSPRSRTKLLLPRAPHLDKIIFRIVPNNNTAINQIQTGEINVLGQTSSLSARQFNLLKRFPNVTTYNTPGFVWDHLDLIQSGFFRTARCVRPWPMHAQTATYRPGRARLRRDLRRRPGAGHLSNPAIRIRTLQPGEGARFVDRRRLQAGANRVFRKAEGRCPSICGATRGTATPS
jgi:hypothetical protein